MYNEINDSSIQKCKGCALLVEKDEEDIEIGKIENLSLSIFQTCNLRCKYCFLDKEKLADQIGEKEGYILPIIKNLHKNNVLKENFSLSLSGGEPTLIKDIPETLEYMIENFEKPHLTLISNSSLTNRVEQLAPILGNLPSKITKNVITSIDAGTAETYKKIRGKDLFYNTTNNLITYAKHKSFDNYLIKYMFQLDYSNLSDEDIFGFLNFIKLLSQNYSGNVKVILDRDYFGDTNKGTDESIIKAAAKIYYCVSKIFNLPIEPIGSTWTNNLPAGKADLKKIKEYAKKYEFEEKTMKEKYYLEMLQASNTSLSEWSQAFVTKKDAIEKFIANNKDKRICFYGAGQFCERILERFDFSSLNILGFVDKNLSKRGTKIQNYTIYSIEDLRELNPDIIVLTVAKPIYVIEQLEKLKQEENYNFKLIDNLFVVDC